MEGNAQKGLDSNILRKLRIKRIRWLRSLKWKHSADFVLQLSVEKSKLRADWIRSFLNWLCESVVGRCLSFPQTKSFQKHRQQSRWKILKTSYYPRETHTANEYSFLFLAVNLLSLGDDRSYWAETRFVGSPIRMLNISHPQYKFPVNNNRSDGKQVRVATNVQ